MNGTLWIDVEVAPGSNIDDACADACELATRLGVVVWFDFNDVKCGARPGDSWKSLAENWSKVMDSKSTYKVAVSDNAIGINIGK